MTSYGSRSLYWAQKFRKLFPYETARTSVMELGLRSKAEWDEYVENGKEFHGPYLPNHPDQMYVDDWVSWDEFLGLRRSYNETKGLARMLGLSSLCEYQEFVRADSKRAEGLRIPLKPEIVYSDDWVSEDHFFSMENE